MVLKDWELNQNLPFFIQYSNGKETITLREIVALKQNKKLVGSEEWEVNFDTYPYRKTFKGKGKAFKYAKKYMMEN